jgi:hypothetical protein
LYIPAIQEEEEEDDSEFADMRRDSGVGLDDIDVKLLRARKFVAALSAPLPVLPQPAAGGFLAFMKATQEEDVVNSEDLPASCKKSIRPGPGVFATYSNVEDEDVPAAGGLFAYIKSTREDDVLFAQTEVDEAAIWGQRTNYLKALLGVKPPKKDTMLSGRTVREERLLGLIQNGSHFMPV